MTQFGSPEDTARRDPSPAGPPVPRVDGVRLLEVLERLGEIGADPGGGVTRLGLGPLEEQARTWLAGVGRSAGLVPRTDPAGNLFLRLPGPATGPVLLIGSHVDTVVQGGRLDGAYGVVAAIEVLRVLHAGGVRLPFDPVAVAFSNEEGALVQLPFFGSRAVCGQLADRAGATDRSGRGADAYLAEHGGDPDRLAEAAWPEGSIAAYLELHIEQGPVLERAGIPIGVVEGIVGRTIVDIEVLGQAQHAGTTPMEARHDALVAAAELVLGVRRIAAVDGVCTTATVGFLRAAPNVTNTVPGTARLTAEVRDIDPARLTAGEAAVRAVCAEVERRTGCRVRCAVSSGSAPVATDPALRRAIAEAADALGLARLALPSGAGHDAQIVASVAPIGMIFVPSTGGISHAPAEDTPPEALVRGADVLLRTVLRLATTAGGDPGRGEGRVS
ncbi:Zn-dependent hydrolase [Streptomyces ginkgonis]|uniref:Zn-dependent hydrolase n=1 Tax=Streptomyces ginkgonis TaxID=1812259 RepID=UPI002176D232|nr:Zn-dependent hydrolase [Streptomyces ginkgonis]